ncbi:DUF3540 domain-containing protein [Andreprevotia chitinilytica]|uniref:DUF3540 domain-containing protein n=1 Tax=Andreprevotia chitinilytica TaxID=396808 RepID=UPI00054F74C8|nr:DUF3540 domain-containing protein [Andreprevotia chitinilytica]
MSLALAQLPHSNTAIHAIGTVTADLGHGTFLTDLSGVPCSCRVAASCLLRPEAGDQVLVSGPSRKQAYLIAVLERDAMRAARIGVEGAMVIGCGGPVALESETEVTLRADAITLQSRALALRAEDAVLRANVLSYYGRQWHGAIGTLRHAGQVMETVVDRLMHVARVAFRQVKEREQVRAGQIDYAAEDYARLHARHTLVTGKELVKADAGQIHIG